MKGSRWFCINKAKAISAKLQELTLKVQLYNLVMVTFKFCDISVFVPLHIFPINSLTWGDLEFVNFSPHGLYLTSKQSWVDPNWTFLHHFFIGPPYVKPFLPNPFPILQ